MPATYKMSSALYFWILSKCVKKINFLKRQKWYDPLSFLKASQPWSNFLKVVRSRKLDPWQKQIILLSRIAILLLKGYFEREKIIFHEKNLKHRKIMLSINCIFAQTYFLIALSQIFKNNAILINHGLFFQEKDSLQPGRFQFLKMNSLTAEIIKKQFFKTKFL